MTTWPLIAPSLAYGKWLTRLFNGEPRAWVELVITLTLAVTFVGVVRLAFDWWVERDPGP